MATTIPGSLDLKIMERSVARYRSASTEEILHAARVRHEPPVPERQSLASHTPDSREFLKLRIGHLEHEVFAVLWLDNRHCVLGFEELFRGTIDGASVHPREVVKSAFRHNAAACILAHNHPSGVSTPSRADQALTRRLSEALALIDVRVLDHIVVARGLRIFRRDGAALGGARILTGGERRSYS